MIISRTPFRISFMGGGSDLSVFYKRCQGAVLSATINKYMYVTVNKRFDKTIRISYSETEIVDTVDEIKHELVREAMRHVGIDGGIEITTIADVPACTGLGSSSSLTVGLLNALYAFAGRYRSPDQLAQEACLVEIEKVGKIIGKQDHFAAAFGGLNYIRFCADESVFVDPVVVPNKSKKQLLDRLKLFYLNQRSDTGDILSAQVREVKKNEDKYRNLVNMTELALKGRDALFEGRFDYFGELLDENWQLKKKLAMNMSDQRIDRWYSEARNAGAIGGKITGAGGGGFLMLFCKVGTQDRVRSTMEGFSLRELEFDWESQGSKIIFYDI